MPRSARRRVPRLRLGAALAAFVLLATVLAACTDSAHHRAHRADPTGPYSSKPNIVYVLTDDLSTNLVQYMPHVIALEQAGMRFSNFTVTDSLCCPSRATIFTGRFPHNTKVFTNGPPDGGFDVFHSRGEEKQTFAVTLHDAGYRTAMMGKYLNGFRVPSDDRRLNNDQDAHYVPPGWSTWDVGGYAYNEFGYDLSDNGTLQHFGTKPSDYLTDVIDRKGNAFIHQSARARKPFFLELASFAPHSPFTPAPRDAGTFHLQAPRVSSFNRHPANAPHWLSSLPPINARQIQVMDKHFTLRVEAVQAVDRMIGHLEETLRATGQLGNTVFVFNSDNGYHLGEHGLTGGKLTAFDTDVRVPLVIAGPGIRPGSVNSDIVENTDLAPTFDELAGASVPSTVDGHSFVSLLHGQNPAWRTVATVEHHGPVFGPADPDHQNRDEGNPPTYDAMRTATYTYVRYLNGSREYYDRTTDPDENDNIIASLGAARVAQLDATMNKLITCRGTTQCWSAALPAAG